MSEIPGDLKFLKSHEWARVEGSGRVTVGISDHAQGLLGDLVYVELPQVGDRVEAGQPITEGSINPNDILRIKGVNAVTVLGKKNNFFVVLANATFNHLLDDVFRATCCTSLFNQNCTFTVKCCWVNFINAKSRWISSCNVHRDLLTQFV